MKFPLVVLLCAVVVAAWTSQDYEIINLQHELRQLGYETFYDFLQVSPKASHKDISKQFKKMSVKYHPDKAKGSKNKKKAVKRFEKLQLVSNVLKAQRDRYDWFLRHGFPEVTSHGIISKVFQPTILFALLAVVVIVNVMGIVLLKVQRMSDLKRITTIINEVKRVANQQDPDITREKRVRDDRLGKTFVVRIDGVFIENDDGELERIEEEVDPVTWRDVLIVKWFVKLWNSTGLKQIDLSLAQNPKEDVVSLEAVNKKKKKQTGEKLVLPNGKVVYGKKKK